MSRTALASLVLVLLLTGLAVPGSAYGIRNDSGAYVYFSSLLEEGTSLLSSVLNGNVTLMMALSFWNVANVTYSTVLSYGIGGSVLELARSFDDLGRGVYLISLGYLRFHNSTLNGDYTSANSAILLMEEGYSVSKKALDALSRISLVINGSEVKLPYENLSKKLAEIGSVIKDYRSLVVTHMKPSGLLIYASTESPYVFQNVTLFGFAPNLSSVSISINGTVYRLAVVNGTFSMVHSFQNPGVYYVYAFGRGSGGEVFHSNVLQLTVRRVPTRILAWESRRNEIVVRGYLVDAFGNGVPNATVVLVAGHRLTTVTSGNGSFAFLVNVTQPVNATVKFSGNWRYGPSDLSLRLIPPRVPLLIRLSSSFSFLSGTLRLTGDVSPSPEYPITLQVYVDGKKWSQVKAENGRFSVNLNLPSGRHVVYVVFEGDKNYLPSTSNPVQVNVSRTAYIVRVLAFFGLLAVGIVLYRRFSVSEKPLKFRNVTPSLSSSPEGSVKLRSVRDVYRIVYGLLIRVLGVKPSITPRELLSRVDSGRNFLLGLTLLHEREVYAGLKLKSGAVKGALKAAANFIVSFFIGEEL